MSTTIDCEFFLKSGLLFEINRQFLHPLGLAMTVHADAQGNKTWGFKDCRHEPEKLLFDKATLEAGRKKLEQFLTESGFQHMERRRKKLGYAVQHVNAWTKS